MTQTLRVLLIDDEPQQRAVVRFLLKKSGLEATCTEAGSVADGLKAFRTGAFDCALLDFSLGDGTALDFLRELPTDAAHAAPVIVLTAQEDEAVDVAASQAGADDFLLKLELKPEALRRVIRRAIARHRHMRYYIPAPPDSEHFGRFLRSSKIGAGGMADVYRAWDTRDLRWVALKILRSVEGDDVLRLSREVVAVSRLSHPNIATIYDAGRERGSSYIAMQLIEGSGLGELPVPQRGDALRAVRQAALALGYAHGQGVIHRDLKPANILVTGLGLTLRAWLVDFGLVKYDKNLLSGSDLIVGTPPYMSPEQIQGGVVDARSDLYSLGATLYSVLAGRPPFEFDSYPQAAYAVVHSAPTPLLTLDPTIDPRLAAITARCLQKNPDARYQTAAEFIADLDPVAR
jgi:CheY-like chemotaxis protein